MAKNTHRRLAAILVSDVVGYSRLMGEDEAGTLDALRSHREQLIEPKIAEHEGRVVKLMGDGLLAGFPSAVEAVQCAVQIQHTMGERNADVPEDRRIIYRVGINIGDIVVEGDDIYGDGVNVAARLEGLADAGGICVARNVYNQVKDKLNLTIDHLGERKVKNIAEPVAVYRVVLDDKAAALVTSVVHETTKPVRRRWMVAAAAVLVAAVGGVSWWQPWTPDVEPASLERMAFPLPERPSIAVLPFDNLSGDDAQDYLVDGITENVITELSRDRSLFVIARNSTAVYKGKPVKISQVAEDLGVRYVMEGSVQLQEDRLRITAQLIDATQGTHIWSDRYDLERKDIFSIQDEIAGTIAATIGGYTGVAQRAEMQRSERKGAIDVTAYDLFLRGIKHKEKFTKEDNAKAQELFLRSIEQDPGSALAFGWLAWVYVMDVYMGWTDRPEVQLEKAFEAARKAVGLDPNLDFAHWSLGAAYMVSKDQSSALANFQKTLELNPNNADAIANTAWPLTYLGRAEEGIEYIERAMRLNPHYPEWYLWGLGMTNYQARRYEEAVIALSKISQHNIENLAYLTAAQAQLGHREKANKAAAEILKMDPGFSLAAFERVQLFEHTEYTDHLLDGLRKAELPE